MATISTATAPDHIELDGLDGHYGPIEAYTVGFETWSKADDLAPLFRGLPDDACQCGHWGVVLEGTLTYRYTDGRVDVIEAGSAYYAPPGHLPVLAAGTRLVEFSPSDALDQTMSVVMANVEAMQAG